MNGLKIIKKGLKNLRSVSSYDDLRKLYQKIKQTISGSTKNYPHYLEVPPVLSLEPTNYCNLDCICCSSQKISREKGYMDFDLFKKIIDEASQIRVSGVDLWLHGEPLLHPKFIEMVRYIKSKNLKIDIATNGMLLENNVNEALLNSGLTKDDRVRISILGHSKEIHEKIQTGVDHERVLNNVFEFLKLRSRKQTKSPRIEIFFYILPENEHEKSQFEDFWKKSVDKVRTPNASTFWRRYKKGFDNPSRRKKPCWDLLKRMTIFWNGDVTICCMDGDGNHILGNLKEESIKSLWTDERLVSVKKLHLAKKYQEFPLCTNCDL